MYFIAPRDLPFQQALDMGYRTLAYSPAEAWVRHTGVYLFVEDDHITEQTRRVQAWSDRGYGPRCVEVSEFVVDESAADVLGNRKTKGD